MVVVMKERASEQEIDAVIARLIDLGMDVHRSSGATRTVLGVVGTGAVEPVRWAKDISASHETDLDKTVRVQEIIDAYNRQSGVAPPPRVMGSEMRRRMETLADTGEGIAPDFLPFVFDRFYRATSARGMPGSGLGLAIVRQVAEAHGGGAARTPGLPLPAARPHAAHRDRRDRRASPTAPPVPRGCPRRRRW